MCSARRTIKLKLYVICMSILHFFQPPELRVTMSTAPPAQTIKRRVYTCKGCNTTFYTKAGLTKHNENACILIHITSKKKKENIDNRNDVTPDIRDLYQAVKILTDKVLELETEVAELKRGGGGGGGRDPLIWLNDNIKPGKTYIDWLSTIRVNRTHLQVVFDYALSDGIIQLLNENEENCCGGVLPVRLFPHRKKIYVFSQDENQEYPRWNDNMSEEELHRFIDILCARFLQEFICWSKENRELIERDDVWKENFSLYTTKIMRTPQMSDRIYAKVKSWLTRK